MMNDNDQTVEGIARFSSSEAVTKRLLNLIDKLGYQLVQENGQRRLTAANFTSAAPRIKGAEIFLGRLPRDCYEDELVPILMKVGRVIELRLMMDFSGSTRGYAFASFEHPRIARKACEELNGYEIRTGHKIGVVKSIDNCRLFLGGVPKDKTKNDFLTELGKMLEGITNIYVYPSTEELDKGLNRGFVFVEFKDHRSAAMARRKLIPGRITLWDHEVAVDWADPEPGQDLDEEVMETVSALFLRNLSLKDTELEVKSLIQRKTGIQIMKIKKINHFAFLHYENRAQAQRVLEIMKHSYGGDESEWELTWAKPIRKSEKLQERLRCSSTKNQAKNGGTNNNGKGAGVSRDDQTERSCELINLVQKSKKNSSYSTGSSGVPPTRMNKKMIVGDPEQLVNNNSDSNTMLLQQNINNMIFNETGNSNLYKDQGYYNNYNHNYSFNQNPPCTSPTVVTTDDDLAQCGRALAELAATRFQANLRYVYWSDSLRNEYFCKIILERNGCELMNYQGNPAGTMHEAILLTVPTAYAGMQSMLMNSKFI